MGASASVEQREAVWNAGWARSQKGERVVRKELLARELARTPAFESLEAQQLLRYMDLSRPGRVVHVNQLREWVLWQKREAEHPNNDPLQQLDRAPARPPQGAPPQTGPRARKHAYPGVAGRSKADINQSPSPSQMKAIKSVKPPPLLAVEWELWAGLLRDAELPVAFWESWWATHYRNDAALINQHGYASFTEALFASPAGARRLNLSHWESMRAQMVKRKSVWDFLFRHLDRGESHLLLEVGPVLERWDFSSRGQDGGVVGYGAEWTPDNSTFMSFLRDDARGDEGKSEALLHYVRHWSVSFDQVVISKAAYEQERHLIMAFLDRQQKLNDSIGPLDTIAAWHAAWQGQKTGTDRLSRLKRDQRWANPEWWARPESIPRQEWLRKKRLLAKFLDDRDAFAKSLSSRAQQTTLSVPARSRLWQSWDRIVARVEEAGRPLKAADLERVPMQLAFDQWEAEWARWAGATFESRRPSPSKKASGGGGGGGGDQEDGESDDGGSGGEAWPAYTRHWPRLARDKGKWQCAAPGTQVDKLLVVPRALEAGPLWRCWLANESRPLRCSEWFQERQVLARFLRKWNRPLRPFLEWEEAWASSLAIPRPPAHVRDCAWLGWWKTYAMTPLTKRQWQAERRELAKFFLRQHRKHGSLESPPLLLPPPSSACPKEPEPEPIAAPAP